MSNSAIHRNRLIWLPFYFSILCVQLLLTHYLASVLLFLLYREHPRRANFFSIEAAIGAATTQSAVSYVVLSIILASLLGLILPWSIYYRYRRRQAAMNIHGKAYFARRREIAKANFFAPHGIVLGRFKGKLLRFPGSEFVLLAAPTRSGKGVGFCVPNLLSFEHSVVVLDIKGENYRLTSSVRMHGLHHEVYCFNPYSEQSSCWNPLDYVSNDPRYQVNHLMLIAAIIYPDSPEQKDPFWKDSCRNLFIGLALFVMESPELPQTMGEILRQSSGKGYPIQDYLRHVITLRERQNRPFSPSCLDALNRFLNTGDQTMRNVLASFVAPLTIFGSPVVDKATASSDFDLRDVRRKKQSIYITIPPSELPQAAFLLNLFFSQLVNENVKVLPETDPSLQYQCLVMLDEFTSIGKMEILAKGVGFLAGYNIRLAIIVQDKAQLESVYGKEDAHNLITNMGVVIYFTPSQVTEAEEISKTIGNVSIEGLSTSYSNISLLNMVPSKSESFQRQSKALMLPQELMTMSRDKQLIVRSGMPVILSDKIYYYKDPEFQSLQKRYGSHGEALPPPKWSSYWASIERSNYYLRPEFSADLSATSSESSAESSTSGGDLGFDPQSV